MAKYAACIQQVERLDETGKGPADQMVDAMNMYAVDVRAEFKDMSCYNLVKQSPKWKTNPTVVEMCGTNGVGDNFQVAHELAKLGAPAARNATDLDALPVLDWPEGSKKAKRNRSGKGDDVQPQLLANQSAGLKINERLANQGDRAATALEGMLDLAVLMTDTSKLDERTRASVEAAKERIHLKNEAAHGVWFCNRGVSICSIHFS